MTRPIPIRALTGVRFLAALAVVLFHNVSLPSAPEWVNVAFRRGDVAVPFFFVLSGFILAYNYARRDVVMQRTKFWQARAARLYPVYLLALVAALPLFVRALLAEHDPRPAHAAAHGAVIAPLVVAMLQAWYPASGLVSVWNAPGWSISVEAFFYALFPFLAPVAARMRRPALLAGLAAAAAVVSDPIGRWLLPDAATFLGRSWPFHAPHHPLVHLATFVLGVACARLFAAWSGSARAARAAGPASTIFLGVVLAIVAFTPDAQWHLWAYALLPVLFAGLVLSLAWDRGPVARLASGRTMLLLGEASYAIYLLHAPTWAYLQLVWTRGLGLESGYRPDKPLAFDVGYVLLSVAIGVVVHLRIEIPARVGVLSWLGRRRHGGGAPVPTAAVHTGP